MKLFHQSFNGLYSLLCDESFSTALVPSYYCMQVIRIPNSTIQHDCRSASFWISWLAVLILSDGIIFRLHYLPQHYTTLHDARIAIYFEVKSTSAAKWLQLRVKCHLRSSLSVIFFLFWCISIWPRWFATTNAEICCLPPLLTISELESMQQHKLIVA